jgi:hypothetical protein
LARPDLWGGEGGNILVYPARSPIAVIINRFAGDRQPFWVYGRDNGLDWLKSLDAVEALGAEIFVPAHGPIPADRRETKQGLARFRQMLVDIRDGVQMEVARGATEEQPVAAVKWPQYEKLQGYSARHDVAVRRLYEQLTGALK